MGSCDVPRDLGCIPQVSRDAPVGVRCVGGDVAVAMSNDKHGVWELGDIP